MIIMKKILLLLLTLMLCIYNVQGEEKYSEIQFETLKINLGKFSEKDAVKKCAFTFKNIGTAPLIINQAFASCGCTTPEFTKEPIKPGEQGSISVTYNGQGRSFGPFSKTITVRSNGKTELVRLTIEGEMTE